MIVKIGKREVDVWAIPWITLVLMGLCGGITGFVDRPAHGGAITLLERAADYWHAHAYLEAEPEILVEIGRGLSLADRREYLNVRRAEAHASRPKRQQRTEEQATLDELTAEALDRTATPAAAGWAPARPSLAALALHPFVHADPLALAGALLLLLLLGAALECAWPRPLTGLAVLAGLTLPALLYRVVSPTALVPLQGASGLTATLLGVHWVRCLRSAVDVPYITWDQGPVTHAVGVPVWVLSILWLTNEIIQAVHYGSHLVPYPGLVCSLALGVAVAVVVRDWNLEALLGGTPKAAGATAGRSRPQTSDSSTSYAVRPSAQRRERPPAPKIKMVLKLPEDRESSETVPQPASAVGIAEADSNAANEPESTDILPFPGPVESPVWGSGPTPRKGDRARPSAGGSGPRPGRAGQTRSSEDPARLIGMLEEATEATEPEPAKILEIWDTARACNRAAEATQIMRDTIHRWVGQGKARDAASLWCALIDAIPDAQLDLDSTVRLAPALAKLGKRDAARLALSNAIVQPEAGLTGSLALRAVEIAKALRAPDLVERAVEMARSSVELSPAELARLESLIGGLDAGSGNARAGSPGAAAASRASCPDARGAIPLEAQPEPELGSTVEPIELDNAHASDLPAIVAEAEPIIGIELDSPQGRFRSTKVVEGTPDLLGEHGLSLQLLDGRRLELEYGKIQAVAAAAIRGSNGEPAVLLIDLLLNWNQTGAAELRVVRLPGNRFDPRGLVGDTMSRTEAYRTLLDQLLGHSEATPLPDAQAARGRPLRGFDDLGSYEREVLGVAG